MSQKARITYRFEQPEHKRPTSAKGGQEAGRDARVIPLLAEEYHVVEEQVQVQAQDDPPVPDRREADEPRWERTAFSSGMFDRRTPLNQFTTDFGSWSSPFDEETERVERAIRETGQATIQEEAEEPPQDTRVTARPSGTPVVHEEAGNDPGPEIWPEEPVSRYAGSDRMTVRSGGTRFERHTRPPWLRIVASVTGAITTGVLIGFFVLHLFSGEDGKSGNPSATTPATSGNQTGAGTNGSVLGGTDTQTGKPAAGASPAASASGSTSGPATAAPVSGSTGSSGAATVSVRIPARTVTLLQVGAFANQQGADQAAADLRKLGLAAATQAADKVYVYAGLTTGRDEALALSNKLKAQKTDVYLKTLSTPTVSSIKWSGKQATVADTYFAQAAKLTTALINVTALHLKESMPGPLEDNTLQTIRTGHQAWSGTAAGMGEGLAEGQRAVLQKMNNALNTAVLSLDEYKKNPSASFLWQAQSGALQYVLLESELLAAIAAG